MKFVADCVIIQVYSHLQISSQSKIFEYRAWRGFRHLAAHFHVIVANSSQIKITHVRWIAPDLGLLKFNFDGSICGNLAGGWGGHDSRGNLVCAFYLPLQADDSLSAKVQALDYGTAMLEEVGGQ